MSVNKYLEGLAKPFDAECVKWRIQVTNNEKTSGLAVAYLDSRTIAKRLDEVVGQMRWKDEYKPWITAKNNASQICTISIYDDSLKEWIVRAMAPNYQIIHRLKVDCLTHLSARL